MWRNQRFPEAASFTPSTRGFLPLMIWSQAIQDRNSSDLKLPTSGQLKKRITPYPESDSHSRKGNSESLVEIWRRVMVHPSPITFQRTPPGRQKQTLGIVEEEVRLRGASVLYSGLVP